MACTPVLNPFSPSALGTLTWGGSSFSLHMLQFQMLPLSLGMCVSVRINFGCDVVSGRKTQVVMF